MGILCCLLISMTQVVDEHSFASSLLNVIVVEAKIVSSTKTDPGFGALALQVEKVGLGADSLVGTKISGQYQYGIGRSLPVYQAYYPKPIEVGQKMVASLSRRGDTREWWIICGWIGDEKRSLASGQKLIPELRELNKATNYPEVRDRVFEALRKGAIERKYVWLQLCNSRALNNDKELLLRVIDSKEIDEQWRKSASNMIKTSKSGWFASDERRDELLLAVKSSQDKQAVYFAAQDLAQAVANQQEADVGKWRKALQDLLLNIEGFPEDQRQSIIKGVAVEVMTEHWSETAMNSNLVLWDCIFQVAAETRDQIIRKSWEDILVRSTQEGQMLIKEDVLNRLDNIKDPTFRDRLREAAYTPSERFKVAPKKPE